MSPGDQRKPGFRQSPGALVGWFIILIAVGLVVCIVLGITTRLMWELFLYGWELVDY